MTDHQCLRMLDCLEVGSSRHEVAGVFGISVGHVAVLKTDRIRKHFLANRHK